MTVVLFRVDERLIHGQVVVGWSRSLDLNRLVVVSDELAVEPVEQEIYRTGLPEGTEVEFWSEQRAIAELPAAMESEARYLVLVSDLEAAWRLKVAGVPLDEVNVGGLHAAAGRERVLSYVYLDEEGQERIRNLEAAGVRVVAQDVPGAPRVRLARVL